MSLSITGYILDPPRVGSSTSPFTLTPDNLVSDQVVFDAAYPSDETGPRSEYLVQVLEEVFSGPTGPGGNRSLPDARFGWTKNEGVYQQGLQVPFQRFNYDGQVGRFKTLQGAPRDNLGPLTSDANTTRLKVTSPLITNLVDFPIRISLGDTGSGTTITVSLVADEGSFGAPAAGTVELALDTGALNWAASDVTTFLGQIVYFQRQSFYLPTDTTGSLGVIGTDTLLLNPKPATGQIPLLSFGSRSHLTVIEVASDGALGAPSAGTVEWSLETGLLRLSAADATAYAGQSMIYEGVLFGVFQTPTTTYASLGAADVVSPIPDEESDVFFRVPGTVQFASTKFVDSTSQPGKSGEVQIERGTGNIQFSAPDIASYGGSQYQYVNPDVEIERGITLRLFRSPVDPGSTDDAIKDITAVYTKEGDDSATLADPMVGQPLVFLPALPLLDYPLDVRVEQGSGSFTGPLNQLDMVPPPAAGNGYIIDFETQQLFYGARKVDEIIDNGLKDYAAFQLPNFPVFSSNFTLEQEDSPGVGTYTTLTLNQDFTLDAGSGVVTFTTTEGTLVVESSGGATAASNILSDSSVDFVSLGVASGDFLVITAGPNTGVYTISAVAVNSLTIEEAFPSFPDSPIQYEVRRGVEILVDRYWRDVPRVDPNTSVTRINGVSSTVLQIGVDYEIQPGTGFVEFTERMLEDEEVLISYATFDDEGNKVPVANERGAFLVSKEVVQPHPTPTSTLSFNPDGKEVASSPPPMAWRGGRPQSGEQVSFNTAASTATFLSDDQGTDALPHGSIVTPDENVYVDYYIHGALGGEKNLTVLNTPMASVQVAISEGDTSFTIEGDRTADFPADHLLLVDGQEVYLLAPPTYDGTLTTVNLDQGVLQEFKTDFNNPTLEITSGATLRVASGTTPSYFVVEGAAYDPAPRGSKLLKIEGDLTRTYIGGTVVLFSDGTFQDYILVEGSTYNSDSDRTEVILGGGIQAQYEAPVTLSHSVRAVLDTPSVQTNTSLSPVLAFGVTVFRRVSGQAGVPLVQGVDYTVDDAGVVILNTPLTLNEEVGIFYTGYDLVAGGTRHRASWNYAVVPSTDNGLVNQVLKMEYSTYIPDTFFFRVETMTNFRGELAQQFSDDAKSNSPSQGPLLENSGEQQLYEKGNKSLFYDEGRYANEDLIARPTLCFYNDAINYLEDYLQAADGRVVGDRDGRFLFDGLIDNPIRANFGAATNQIDDYITTYSKVRKAYSASSVSRFFPTRRRTAGEVVATPTETGDVVYDTGYSPISNIGSPSKRFPFAMVTSLTPAGQAVFEVDEGAGSVTFFRPAFAGSMEVDILAQDGTVLDSGLTVSSATAGTITIGGGASVDVPTGSTIILSSGDTTYQESYGVGISVLGNLNDGLIEYVEASNFFSFLPFVSPPPPPIPSGGDYWDVDVGASWQETEPFRFPALDGLTTDDDGLIQTRPLLNPQLASEVAGGSGVSLLAQEQAIILELLSDTAGPINYVGSLDGPGTTLTLDAGSFSTTPRVGDLVKIISGANAGTTWVRVTGGTPTTATLEAFYVTDSSFTFHITNAASLSSGSGVSVSVASTTFTDTGADFIGDGVAPGMTLVIESGANIRQRRNIVSVSTTSLILTSAFTTSATTTFAYRVDNPLSTFGQAPLSAMEFWLAKVGSLEGVYDSEVAGLEGYINTVGADVINSATGSASGSTLTDFSEDFSEVTTLDVLFVRTGSNFGFYTITDVPTTTTLEVSPPFPLVEGGMGYRVLKTTATSAGSLANVQQALGNADTALSNRDDTAAAYSIEPVNGDPGAFAHSIFDSDLILRLAQVATRNSQVTTDIENISAVMASIDRLYDTRYVWIDGRINLENGILVKQERAVEQREENLEKLIKNLTKLLTAG